MSVRDTAWSICNSEILALDGCIERLGGIKNDNVNIEAQASEIGRMETRLEAFRFMFSLIENNVSEAEPR